MSSIENSIDQKIGEVRTEALDLSFGEIVNLHSSGEIIIQPEYQRLFRWTLDQRSRLIESILLELPIPQIFLIENENGVLELIDGLQRVCSVIQFIEPSALELEPLRLQGCDIISELNDYVFGDLPLRLKLRLKRSSVRAIVIKRQSKSLLRYEMFKRLNTGGSILAPQEIRNCTARMVGETGVKFYKLLQDLANDDSFKNCIEPLPQPDKDQKADEELVLRFFATKNARDLFKGSVRDWLDTYMERILLGAIVFDYEAESQVFASLFNYLNRVLGDAAFVRYRGTVAVGALAPAYFEGVTIGTLNVLNQLEDVGDDTVKAKIIETVQSQAFRDVTGPGANSREKLEQRVAIIQSALAGLVHA